MEASHVLPVVGDRDEDVVVGRIDDRCRHDLVLADVAQRGEPQRVAVGVEGQQTFPQLRDVHASVSADHGRAEEGGPDVGAPVGGPSELRADESETGIARFTLVLVPLCDDQGATREGKGGQRCKRRDRGPRSASRPRSGGIRQDGHIPRLLGGRIPWRAADMEGTPPVQPHRPVDLFLVPGRRNLRFSATWPTTAHVRKD
jgi:hypothetical protein